VKATETENMPNSFTAKIGALRQENLILRQQIVVLKKCLGKYDSEIVIGTKNSSNNVSPSQAPFRKAKHVRSKAMW